MSLKTKILIGVCVVMLSASFAYGVAMICIDLQEHIARYIKTVEQSASERRK